MNLSTRYMGIPLKNPVVPSASPLSRNPDNIRLMEDKGAAAVVMHSLFEEQIIHESRQLDHYLEYGTESFAESLNYLPDMKTYNIGPDGYLNLIRLAKEAVDIPIIASLNGVSSGGWVEYAEKIEQAGADGLELNIAYIPTDPALTGTEVEQMYFDIVKDVKKTLRIPVAVKMSFFFSAIANMANRLSLAGADALVLFNRFYQPDLDLEKLEVIPRLVLSNSYDMRLPLRWVAILQGQVNVDFAISSGVHNHEDALKGLMVGAKVVMMASELLQNGIGRIEEILNGITGWMEEHEYESVAQMQGCMCWKHVADPEAFERANYMKELLSWRPDPTRRFM